MRGGGGGGKCLPPNVLPIVRMASPMRDMVQTWGDREQL
jgi:hypothetical protein